MALDSVISDLRDRDEQQRPPELSRPWSSYSALSTTYYAPCNMVCANKQVFNEDMLSSIQTSNGSMRMCRCMLDGA